MANEQQKKLESQLNDLTTERLKIEKEIADVKAKVNNQLKTSVSETEKLLKLEALRLDNYEKEEELRKKIEKIEIDSQKRLDETFTTQKNSTGEIKDQVDLSKQLETKHSSISKSVKNLVEDQSQSSALIRAINGDSSKTLEYVENQKLAYSVIGNSLQSINTIQGGTTQQQLNFSEAQTRNVSLADDLLNTENKLQMAKEKGNGSSFEAIDLSQIALDIKVREADLEQNKSNMTNEQYLAATKTLDLIKGRFKEIQNENNALQEQADKINLIADSVSGIGLNAGALINKFPGGDKINRIMGIDKTTNEMKKKFGDAIKSGLDGNFKDAFKQGLGGLKSMVSLAPKFLAALGIGLLISAVNFLVGAIGKADEEAAEIGQQFGITRKESFALRDATVDIAGQMKLVGINSKEVVKGIKTTSEIMGGIDIAGQIASGNKQAQQLVKDVTVLSEKFEMSAEEIKNIQTISAMSGKSMGQLTKEATTLGKGIMTSKESLKALAKIPPAVQVAFKGGTQELIKAAQKAQALGHDLKKVQDIGDGLMDIETSLNKEMEARVLTGKNINLDLARQYALEGDIGKLQDELLNQAGSLEDFTKMNRLAQKSMAEAMGMSVEEMTEMLTNAEKLKTLGISQERMTKLQSMNAAELNKELAKGGSAQLKDYIQQLAKEKESAEVKKRMANVLEKVQEKLSKLLTPILEMVHGMLDAAEAGGDFDTIVASISGIIKGIIPIVKVLFSTLSTLLKPITSVLGLFFSVEDTTQSVTDGVGKVSGGVDKVTGAVKGTEAGFGDVLKAVTLIGGAFAAKSLIGAGLNMMKEKAIDVGKSIMSNIGGSLSKVGGKIGGIAGKSFSKMGGIAGKALSKIGGGKAESIATSAGETGGGGGVDTKGPEKGKNIVSGILDKVKSIIDSIKGVIKSAIDLFREVGKDLLATLNDLIAGIGNILRTGVKIIVDVGTQLAEGAMKILNIIMKGLAQAAATLPGIMGSLGAAVVAFFTPMAALMNPAIIVGIIIFTAAMIGLGYAFKLLGEGIGAAAPGIKAFFEGVGGIIQKVGEAIAKVIETITTSVIRLQNIDGEKMVKAALGIYAISGALAAFGGGSAIAGLGSALGKLFDEDPVDKFNRFAGINAPGLLAVATAVNLLGSAMKNFNFGSVDGKKLEEFGDGLSHLVKSISGNALAEGFAKLTGGEGPIVKIQQLMTSLDPAKMSSVSKSLLEVSNSLKILADTINNLNVDKLSEVMDKVSGGGIGSKISNAVGSLVGGITSLLVNDEEDKKQSSNVQSTKPIIVSPTSPTSMDAASSSVINGNLPAQSGLSMANVEKKLDTLISVISEISSKPTIIKFGEKTVEEIKSQMDFKKTYNVALDNTYGRMVQK